MKPFYRLFVAALVALVATITVLPGTPVQADQALPPYAWYAVSWTQPNDMLHWISPLGEVASIQRPQLPGELANSALQLLISPDGRYLVQVGQVGQQQDAIGIYDLQAGAWIKTHQAQPGESIILGTQASFSLMSNRVAVGLMSGDYDNPAWRVIVFDLVNGDALAVLDHTNPNAPSGQLVIPLVKYYNIDEGIAEEVVHIQFIPYGTGGGTTYPAYAWLPFPAPANQAIAVTTSPYTRAESDIQRMTGEEVYAFSDPNYGSLPPNGPAPSNNAIGRGYPNAVESQTSVFADGTSWNFNAKWANSGEWVLYWTNTDQNFENWNIILAGGTPLQNQRLLLGALQGVAGTPDGALLLDTTGVIRHTTNIQDPNGTVVFDPAGQTSVEIVYVTPPGTQFTLSSLGDNGIAASGDIAAPQICAGAAEARLTVGAQARVTYTDGTPLNVRANPGGDKLAEIAEGTVVDVIGGPQCQDGFNWWQISVVQGAAVSGWSAEGDAQEYYLEPWTELTLNPGVVVIPSPTATPGLVIQAAPTATPPLVIQAAPTATPVGPGDISAGDCSLAPSMHVAVGMSVVAAQSNGTYAFFNSLSDDLPQRQISPGTQGAIVGGPGCKNGYRMWQVQFNVNGQLFTGWISEGTQQFYFIDPA